MKVAIVGNGNMGCAMSKLLDNSIVVKKGDDISSLNVDVIIFAIKPQIFDEVLPSYAGKSKLYISVAAGITIAKMKNLLGENAHIIRTMPNLATSIANGTTAICRDNLTTDIEFTRAVQMFDKFGATIEVAEYNMDAVVALSGSSPAYGFMLLSAMCEFGIANGLEQKESLKLAANAMIGAMNLALQHTKTPDELCEMVCSPNGTTIEAINHLKKHQFKEILIEAMQKCKDRSEQLAK